MVSSEVLTRGWCHPMQIGATLYVVGGEHRHRGPDERSLGDMYHSIPRGRGRGDEGHFALYSP